MGHKCIFEKEGKKSFLLPSATKCVWRILAKRVASVCVCVLVRACVCERECVCKRECV